MNYISQFLWKRSTIGYGCLVLLGSVTVAGIAEVEIKNQIFSNLVQKAIQNIKERASSRPDSNGQVVTSENVFYPFRVAGQEVGKVATTVWPYVTVGLGAIVLLFKNIGTWWTQIKSFLSSLTKSEIYTRLFKDLHLKIWKILVFALIGGAGRTQFLGLFGEKNKDSTLMGLKFLLGSHTERNKKFRAKPEVFPYLLSRWFDEPDKVTDKFERLTKNIKNLTEKINNKDSKVPQREQKSQDDKYVYELGIPTVRDYIDVEKGLNEALFNFMWTAEIMSKVNTGVDITGGSKTFLPIVLGGLWK